MTVAYFETVEDIARNKGFSEESDFTDDDVREILNEFQQQFADLATKTEHLEQIKPEEKFLLNLHVRAIGYFRGFLKYHDLQTVSIFNSIQGLDREAASSQRKADGWLQTFQGAREELAKEMLIVRQRYPEVYNAVISESVLDQLQLR